jgi:hypothetical protein
MPFLGYGAEPGLPSLPLGSTTPAIIECPLVRSGIVHGACVRSPNWGVGLSEMPLLPFLYLSNTGEERIAPVATNVVIDADLGDATVERGAADIVAIDAVLYAPWRWGKPERPWALGGFVAAVAHEGDEEPQIRGDAAHPVVLARRREPREPYLSAHSPRGLGALLVTARARASTGASHSRGRSGESPSRTARTDHVSSFRPMTCR